MRPFAMTVASSTFATCSLGSSEVAASRSANTVLLLCAARHGLFLGSSPSCLIAALACSNAVYKLHSCS